MDGFIQSQHHKYTETLGHFFKQNTAVFSFSFTSTGFELGLSNPFLMIINLAPSTPLNLSTLLPGLGIHWLYPLKRSRTTPKRSVLGMTLNYFS